MQAEMMSSPSLNAYVQPPRMSEYDDVYLNSSDGFDELGDFTFDCAAAVTSPIPADEIFHNGRIKSTNDQFQQALLLCPPKPDVSQHNRDEINTTTSSISKRKALRSLFTEERSVSADVSTLPEEELVKDSESASELDSLPSDSYCVWEPKREKGNSWSKRWRVMDLLTRNASGKESHSTRSGGINKNPSKVGNDDDDENEKKAPQARKTATKEGGGGSGRRSSNQPYRPQLVGLFGSARY